MKLHRFLFAGPLAIGLLMGCAANPGKSGLDGMDTGKRVTPTTAPVNAAASELERRPKTTSTSNSTAKIPKPDLSGYWVLNEELSDDAREKIKEAMGEFHQGSRGKGMGGGFGRGGKGGAGGMGRGGRGGGMAGGQMKGGMSASKEKMTGFMRPIQSMKIIHEDPRLLIVNDQGRKRRLYTDDRGSSISISGGMNQQVSTAGWEKNELVVETVSGKSGRFSQRYKLDEGGSKLSITTEIDIQQLAKRIMIKSFYDRSIDSDGGV